MNQYLRHLRAIGRSRYTIKSTKYGLNTLAAFLEEEKVHHLEDLGRDVLADYQEDLAFRLTAKGKLLSLAAREKLIGVAKGFTRFLGQKDYLFNDPGDHLQAPKRGRRLPRSILSPAEMKRLISAPDTRTNQGVRDRVILELLYDTGIRRGEVNRIKLSDLDLKAGYIRIHGKGNKDRVVPVSETVCERVENYILFVRPAYIKATDSGHLVLNRLGNRITADGIYVIVKRYGRLAGIKQNVTPHALRHTCATHMLKNGAPVRHLQEMLGHESLESTQIYTHVTINDLKDIHAKYHPGNAE